MSSWSEEIQHITLSEESNSYKISLTILFIQDKPQLTTYNQIFTLIEDYKQELMDSGNFTVIYLADQEILLKIKIFFVKKQDSLCNLNTRVLPDVKLLSSCVCFKEIMRVQPQLTQPKNNINVCSQLTVNSFIHQFVFDQLHDTLNVSLRIENPQMIANYYCCYQFGSFVKANDSYKQNQQQQLSNNNNTQLFKQLELENQSCKDEINNKTVSKISIEEEIPQLSDLSSTKSNQFIASPQLQSWRQQELIQFPILRVKKSESFNSYLDAKFNQDNIHQRNETVQEQQNQTVGEKQQLNQPKRKSELIHKISKFDTKNVVKNFVKAFDIFFSDKQRDQEITQILAISVGKLKQLRQMLNCIETSMKYNNKMIISIINSELNEGFKLFLKKQALNWINSSSVFDKQAHITILKDYITAASNPQEIYKLINLRVRNRISAQK